MYREVDFVSHDMKADRSTTIVSEGSAGDGNPRLRSRSEDGGIVSVFYGEHILNFPLVVVEDWNVLVVNSGLAYVYTTGRPGEIWCGREWSNKNRP